MSLARLRANTLLTEGISYFTLFKIGSNTSPILRFIISRLGRRVIYSGT